MDGVGIAVFCNLEIEYRGNGFKHVINAILIGETCCEFAVCILFRQHDLNVVEEFEGFDNRWQFDIVEVKVMLVGEFFFLHFAIRHGLQAAIENGKEYLGEKYKDILKDLEIMTEDNELKNILDKENKKAKKV